MNICESLTIPARLFPEKTAIIQGARLFNYEELNALSIRAAEALRSVGVEPGDRVAIMLPNAVSFPAWYYATLRIGAIAVSVSTRLAGSEVKFIVDDCDAKVLVVDESTVTTIANSLSGSACIQIATNEDCTSVTGCEWSATVANNKSWFDAEPDSAALILYTSGTTGFPKGATLSHANVRSNVHAFNHLCGMQADVRVLLAVPLFHCFGQNALLNSVLNVGGTLVLQQKFDLNESKRLIAEHQISQLYGVPMMFQLMLDSCTPGELASVDYCFSAAATLPIQTSQAWQDKFNLPIHEGYGLTETSPFASYNHAIKFTAGSIGMPIDSVEMRVVDTETGKPCEPGELGEIAIRGPNVMLGYWNRPQETADSIRDGWFYSGDIGRIDEDGFYYIVDRVKDMITVGGLKAFPAEVERVLLDVDEILQAAVVGIPDPVFGEQVIATVVASETGSSMSESELKAVLQKQADQHLANYKIPRQFIVVDELPRNPSGKVLKTKLREVVIEQVGSHANGSGSPNETGAGSEQPTNTQPSGLLTSELKTTHASERLRVATGYLQQLMQDIAKSDSLADPEQSFVDAGLDSLMIVELTARLQQEPALKDKLPATLVFDYPRITDMAGFLVEHLAEQDSQKSKNETPQVRLKPNRINLRTGNLKAEVESMSEEQALAELMQELN